MSTHNIGFYEDLTKNISELSSNIIKYAPYFFCCICNFGCFPCWFPGRDFGSDGTNFWLSLTFYIFLIVVIWHDIFIWSDSRIVNHVTSISTSHPLNCLQRVSCGSNSIGEHSESLKYKISRDVRKPTFWFPTWSDTNQAVQLQKMAIGLKFRI